MTADESVLWMSKDGMWVYDGKSFWKTENKNPEIVINEELFSLSEISDEL